MGQQVRIAFLVAIIACIAALVYVKLPGLPESAAATSTPSVATSTLATSTTEVTVPPDEEERAPFYPAVEIGGQSIRVVIADTPQKRAQGLSGAAGLASNEGMLFVFPKPDTYAIWMKDMLFSIDIVWIQEEGIIVGIEENAAPESYPATFQPDAPASYVLELPAGFVEEYNVQKGDVVAL